MDVSKASLNENAAKDKEAGDQTSTSKIYRLIRDMASAAGLGKGGRIGNGPGRRGRRGGMVDDSDEDEEDGELAMVDVKARVFAKGFTETQVMETIIEVSPGSRPLPSLCYMKEQGRR